MKKRFRSSIASRGRGCDMIRYALILYYMISYDSISYDMLSHDMI